MMKFFRKYTKHLLAVFMSLLLVVWLGGSALTNVLRSDASGADEVRGKAFGQIVRQKDMWPAVSEIDVLNDLVRGWRFAWAHTLAGLGVSDMRTLQEYAMRIRSEELTNEEWYMLSTEAARNGVYVPAEAVDHFKSRYLISGERINAVRRYQRKSLAEIDRALHAYLRVQELALLVCQAVQVSEADVQHFVRQTHERVDVSIVVLDAAKFTEESYEPTEEELQAHFDNYKDVASQPANELEFGYQLPEAVQVEYIKVSVEPLVDRQTIADKVAWRYWDEHRDEFKRPATQPAKPADPTKPPKVEKPEPYRTFTEAKADVLAKLKGDAAKREALRIARELIAQLGKPWADVPTTQPGDYKVPPEAETADDVYPRLVERRQNKYSGTLECDRTELLDQRGWSEQPELGRVVARAGTSQHMTVERAAFMVAGLEAQPEDNPNHMRYFRNVYETCAEPFVDVNGNAYVMRTVATRPRQAPEAIGPLREQLVKDLRRQRSQEESGQRARALMERASKVGLEEAFRNDEGLFELLGEQALNQPRPFARQLVIRRRPIRLFPNFIPGIGSDPELVGACFALAGKTTTQPARVLMHEQRGRQRWLVVQLHGVEPVTQDEYDRERATAVQYYRFERQVDVLANWFGADELRARVGWVDALAVGVEPEEKDEQPDEEEAS